MPSFTAPSTSRPPRSLATCRVAMSVLAMSGLTMSAVIGTLCAAAEPPVGTGATATIVATLSRGQPMLANVSDEYQVVRLWPNSDAFLAARDALRQPCEDLEFREVGLREAVAAIARKSGTEIVFDREPLESLGIDMEVPVTATGRGCTFQACLSSLLDDLDLAVAFRHDRLVVTTKDEANRDLEKVFYPVIPGVDVDAVVALIEQLVAPDSWATVGGICSILPAPAGLGNGLVISQTGEVHEQIESMLRGLDAAHWSAEFTDEGVQPRFVRIYEIDDDGIRADLENSLVELVNGCLPHGVDPDASVTPIGRSLAVRSVSRPFQVMAAQIISAVTGTVQEIEIEAEMPGDALHEAAEGEADPADDART